MARNRKNWNLPYCKCGKRPSNYNTESCRSCRDYSHLKNRIHSEATKRKMSTSMKGRVPKNLKTCGFELIRLSESEINTGKYEERLKEVLEVG